MTITTDLREQNGVTPVAPATASAFDLFLAQLNGLTGLNAAFPNGIAEIDFEQSGGAGPHLKLHIRGLPTSSAVPAVTLGANGATPTVRLRWNTPGHEVVALLAEKLLASESPEVHRNILGIIGNDPRQRPDMLTLASWPDDVKHTREFSATAPWHFVDIVYTPGAPVSKQFPAPPHVVSALTDQRQVLSSSNDAGALADALAYVIHFVGDIHQPLHCATLVNADFPAPKGDEGGNLIKFSEKENLHSLWDDIVATSPKVADSTSDALLEKYTRDSLAEDLKVTEVAQWAWESHAIARDAYDRILAENVDSRPSPDYRQWARGVAEKRVALAGYRLADVLRAALG